MFGKALHHHLLMSKAFVPLVFTIPARKGWVRLGLTTRIALGTERWEEVEREEGAGGRLFEADCVN